MDRRETIKSLLLGSVAASLALKGCAPDEAKEELTAAPQTGLPVYGRTKKERERDMKLESESFFNEHELVTIATLCDIILPKNESFGSASDAKVPDFIAFIVKDMPDYQVPLRGGIMWLDNYSNKLYDKDFVNCSPEQQLAICDRIAYPGRTAPELKQGEHFFTAMRNLTLTGYYTTKMGIDDLGYKGNMPNVWDGVPEDVLQAHGMEYDPEWLAKCVDQSKRNETAEWDDDGNLIS